jgi:hypothetical protein
MVGMEEGHAPKHVLQHNKQGSVSKKRIKGGPPTLLLTSLCMTWLAWRKCMPRTTSSATSLPRRYHCSSPEESWSRASRRSPPCSRGPQRAGTHGSPCLVAARCQARAVAGLGWAWLGAAAAAASEGSRGAATVLPTTHQGSSGRWQRCGITAGHGRYCHATSAAAGLIPGWEGSATQLLRIREASRQIRHVSSIAIWCTLSKP